MPHHDAVDATKDIYIHYVWDSGSDDVTQWVKVDGRVLGKWTTRKSFPFEYSKFGN